MAKVLLKDFFINNTTSQIVAVTWQLAMDKEFEIIVDETVFDTENILSWTPEIIGYGIDRNNYSDDALYIRVKVYTKDVGFTHESDWYNVKLMDPNNGESDLTYNGKVVGRIKDNKDGTYTTLY